MDMTTRYAEALARIEGNVKSLEKHLGYSDKVEDIYAESFVKAMKEELSAWTTLKAALEFHGPFTTRSGLLVCAECSNDPYEDSFVSFPCPTAEKIIEGVLG